MVNLVILVQMENRAKLDKQVLLDIPEVKGTRETRVATAIQAQKENLASMD